MTASVSVKLDESSRLISLFRAEVNTWLTAEEAQVLGFELLELARRAHTLVRRDKIQQLEALRSKISELEDELGPLLGTP